MNLIVQIIGRLLRFGWSVLSFFVLPIFALQELSVFGSLKESGNTMKKMWGESIGATFSLRLINFLGIMILGIVVWVPSWMFIQIAHPHPVGPISALIWVVTVIVLFMLPFILLFPFTSAASTLFRTAAYLYTLNQPTGPFSTDFIKTSFIPLPEQPEKE